MGLRLTRCIYGAAAVALLVTANAQHQKADKWICGIFAGASPQPRIVAESSGDEAWQLAREFASKLENSLVLVGTGRSMQPLYPAGTVLVLQETDYSKLQRGQTALYRGSNNRAVAHVLVAKARDGWRARGLNNRLHDMHAVVPENLIGVVVAAFVPSSTSGNPSRRATALFQSDL